MDKNTFLIKNAAIEEESSKMEAEKDKAHKVLMKLRAESRLLDQEYVKTNAMYKEGMRVRIESGVIYTLKNIYLDRTNDIFEIKYSFSSNNYNRLDRSEDAIQTLLATCDWEIAADDAKAFPKTVAIKWMKLVKDDKTYIAESLLGGFFILFRAYCGLGNTLDTYERENSGTARVTLKAAQYRDTYCLYVWDALYKRPTERENETDVTLIKISKNKEDLLDSLL